jgi:hypothetical protein
MAKFSGNRNIIVYSTNGRWTCSCGRTFRRARKCLRCGDKLPRWIKAGKITMDQRNRMSLEEYEQWMTETLVADAMKSVTEWIGGT